jgi:acetyl-CoA C-acetyltransferase
MGQGVQAGQGQSAGRQAAIYAGMPEETNAYTVNKVCGSGMKAIALAAQAIAAGDAEIVVAGGMENMSNVPFGLNDARWVTAWPCPQPDHGLMVFDGLTEIFNGYHMG